MLLWVGDEIWNYNEQERAFMYTTFWVFVKLSIIMLGAAGL